MPWSALRSTLAPSAGADSKDSLVIVKLTDDELTRVIGGFDDFGTSTSSVSASAQTCDGTKVCCCKET